MRSWTDLETAFRALSAPGFEPRLDHHWGAAGEHWRLAAGSPGDTARFEALARIAGTKLLSLPVASDWSDIVAEQDPVRRWYHALRQLSSSYRVDGYGVQKDEQGQDVGFIGLGRIDRVYEASAILCLKLESLAAIPRRRVDALCAVPRYSGPCQHWRTAQDLLSTAEPDLSGAVHEAVSTVEGLCRIILSEPSITLGNALQRLRQKGLLHPALSKSIDGLWGYASAEPGIRHGASVATTLKPQEAHFAIDACEAALILLLTVDENVG